MKYVVFTYYGSGLPIALRLKQEGQDVLVAQVQDQADVLCQLEQGTPPEDAETQRRRLALYDGLVPKVDACAAIDKLRREKNPEQTFLFFDLNHLFRFAEPLREQGFQGNFPTEEDYLLEIDRERAKDFVAKNYPQIHVAQKVRLSKASEAKAFLNKSDGLWVLKGLAENCRSVVPDVDDPELAKGQILDALAQDKEYETAGFILEELIRDAIELTPEKVYYDGEPVYTIMCLENKPIGAGNIGMMTDCSQDLVFATSFEDSINQIAFPPVVDEMAKAHRGAFFWDASLLIDPRNGKIYFGEFCANRPGYSCLYTEIALAGSATKYFESLVAKKSPHPERSVAASVRLFSFKNDPNGAPMPRSRVLYNPAIERDLWLCDLTQRRGQLESAGYYDSIGVITGAGRTVGEAAGRAYRSVDQFSVEGAYYRPLFDFLSREYRTSILNRLDYGLQRGFYKIGFGIG